MLFVIAQGPSYAFEKYALETYANESHNCQRSSVRPLVVFLPGGPGFNSNPERSLLFPYLESLGLSPIGIDEPSQLRSSGFPFTHENAFHHYLVNAKKSFLGILQHQKKWIESNHCRNNSKIKVTLVAHSFGVHAVVYLAKKFPKNIKKIILFSPGLNIDNSDKNILTLAANGLASSGDYETSVKIFQLMNELQPGFNQKKLEAFTLASKYEPLLLFTNYWSSFENLSKYFSFLTGAFAFDPASFFSVRLSMPIVKLSPNQKISIPTITYFGENDPVIVRSNEIPYLRNYFKHNKYKVLKNSKHYSHIEFPELVRWR